MKTLVELYEEGWSTTRIAKRLNLKQPDVYYILKKSGIRMRGHSEAAQLSYRLGLNNMEKGLAIGRQKGHKRGGVHHKLSPEGRRKLSEARRRDAYRMTGDKNPAKRPDVRAKMSASRRAYMAEHPEFVEWLKRRGLEIKALSMLVPQRPPTKPEKRFVELSQKLGLPFRYVGNGQVWIGGLNPDFVDVNGRKIAVDILGDYWHSPLFNYGIKPKAVLDQRRKIMQSFGWKLVHFWESELRNESAVKLITKRLEEVAA